MNQTLLASDVPAMLGAYRVRQKLGEGGMGAVYLAEHTLLGRRAAIKMLHPSYSQRPEIVERFFNEARAATSIADPGIVQIFDFGQQDGIAFIVMEFLEGEALDTRLRRLGRLPVVDVLRITRQLALSLHAAHRAGVVHRDLKPENIFLVRDPEVVGGERTRILDFGIAKLTDTTDRVRTQTGMMIGTPVYMSPEQCRGAGSVDYRSDVYSLGCVMFHLLTGRPPFDAEGTGELLVLHLQQPAPPPSQFVPVPPAVDALVLRCLEKHREQRFASMHELAVEADRILRGYSNPPGAPELTPLPAMATIPPFAKLTTLSTGAGQVTARSPRTRRSLVVAASVVLAAAAIAIGVVVTRGSASTAAAQPQQISTPAHAPRTPSSAASPPAPAATAIAPPVSPPPAPPATTPAAAAPPASPPAPTEAHTRPRHAPRPPATSRPKPPPTATAIPSEDPYGER